MDAGVRLVRGEGRGVSTQYEGEGGGGDQCGEGHSTRREDAARPRAPTTCTAWLPTMGDSEASVV